MAQLDLSNLKEIHRQNVYHRFHYQRDFWRVNQVRNIGMTMGVEPNPLITHADWARIKKKGDKAVREWIEGQLVRAGVTAVLIGAETYSRPWVLYEIQRSNELKKGLVGIRIHGLTNMKQETDHAGPNPLDMVSLNESVCASEVRNTLSDRYKTYDYVMGDGVNNLPLGLAEAAAIAGRRTGRLTEQSLGL